MGLEDRDYMREVPIYQDLVGRGDGPPPIWNSTTTTASPCPAPNGRPGTYTQHVSWIWLVLAVLGAVGFFVYKVHRMDVTTAPSVLAAPASAPMPAPTPSVAAPRAVPPPARTYPLTGATTAPAGSTMTATGTLPPGVDGPIVVEAQWNSTGPWYRLATAMSVNGGYRVRYLLDRPGPVQVRIELPNGDAAVGAITVTEPTSGQPG